MLRYGEGCSYEEIGEQLGLTLSAVDTRLYRAKKQLKVILKRYGIENYPF
jgi:RNA polymerase sigma factor (sigma-70 family)